MARSAFSSTNGNETKSRAKDGFRACLRDGRDPFRKKAPFAGDRREGLPGVDAARMVDAIQQADAAGGVEPE